MVGVSFVMGGACATRPTPFMGALIAGLCQTVRFKAGARAGQCEPGGMSDERWQGTRTVSGVYVMGDVHGQYERATALLQAAGLLDASLRWSGGRSSLWFIGDLVDRGPAGLQVIDLVMRLQHEAATAGGDAACLLGNHDALLVSAYRFGAWPGSRRHESFAAVWLRNGGLVEDLAGLTPEHIAWITTLPAMARVGPYLLTHGDTMLYTRYGRNVAEVNAAFSDLLQSDDALRWSRLLSEFSEHRAFIGGAEGAARAAAFRWHFGGEQIVHGHTPICRITGDQPGRVREALVYADDQCIDVDGGLYLGGPGFVYRLPNVEPSASN